MRITLIKKEKANCNYVLHNENLLFKRILKTNFVYVKVQFTEKQLVYFWTTK